jgi:hypothetical protein
MKCNDIIDQFQLRTLFVLTSKILKIIVLNRLVAHLLWNTFSNVLADPTLLLNIECWNGWSNGACVILLPHKLIEDKPTTIVVRTEIQQNQLEKLTHCCYWRSRDNCLSNIVWLPTFKLILPWWFLVMSSTFTSSTAKFKTPPWHPCFQTLQYRIPAHDIQILFTDSENFRIQNPAGPHLATSSCSLGYPEVSRLRKAQTKILVATNFVLGLNLGLGICKLSRAPSQRGKFQNHHQYGHSSSVRAIAVLLQMDMEGRLYLLHWLCPRRCSSCPHLLSIVLWLSRGIRVLYHYRDRQLLLYRDYWALRDARKLLLGMHETQWKMLNWWVPKTRLNDNTISLVPYFPFCLRHVVNHTLECHAIILAQEEE